MEHIQCRLDILHKLFDYDNLDRQLRDLRWHCFDFTLFWVCCWVKKCLHINVLWQFCFKNMTFCLNFAISVNFIFKQWFSYIISKIALWNLQHEFSVLSSQKYIMRLIFDAFVQGFKFSINKLRLNKEARKLLINVLEHMNKIIWKKAT